jgi:two-component system cell cycle response regulator DivK
VKYVILVVEDNHMNRELLCDWLESEGHEVLSAEDLGAARNILKHRQPDAVLLDVQLDNEDGLSLAAWIRQQVDLRHLPVIAVSAHAMVTEQQRFLHAGCNACISKPLNFKLLSAELERWLCPKAQNDVGTSRSGPVV